MGNNIKLIRDFETGDFVISSEKGLKVYRDFKMLGFTLEKIGKFKFRLGVLINEQVQFDCEITMKYEITIEKIMELYKSLEILVFLNYLEQ